MRFFKRDIPDWIDGTESLSDGEYRAYDVICNLIYQNEGAITNHERGFAARCNQHVLKFRIHFQALVALGKIQIDADGKITNARCINELSKIGKGKKQTLDQPRGNPQPTSDAPKPNLHTTSDQPPPGSPSKQLKSLDPQTLQTREEKTRQEDKVNGAHAPPKATKKTRITPDSVITEKHLVYAASLGIQQAEARDEFDRFKDHHLARSTAFTDWDAAWRTWCRNHLEFSVKGGRQQNGSKRSGFMDAGFELIRESEEKERHEH